MELSLTSPAFEHEGLIPPKFTCDGENVSPELSIAGVPGGVQSLALIMDDPDVPKVLRPDGVFDHWVLFNISPETEAIEEGAAPGISGANTRAGNAYTGPCPPPQYEPKEHRYFFKLYALDSVLALPEGSSKKQIEEAMEGHILAHTELMGRYQRN